MSSKVPPRSKVVQNRPASRARNTEDDLYNVRMPSSARRYQPIPAERALIPSQQKTEKHNWRMIVGAIGMLVLIWFGSLVWNWCNGVMDNVRYGYPRTSQLDAVVGHNDSAANQTHFIFLNLHGHVEIIEIPGGDASHARIFTGPTLLGSGQDLIPVTGEIRQEDGRLDLIIHIQNQQVVYVNDGSTFHQQ